MREVVNSEAKKHPKMQVVETINTAIPKKLLNSSAVLKCNITVYLFQPHFSTFPISTKL